MLLKFSKRCYLKNVNYFSTFNPLCMVVSTYESHRGVPEKRKSKQPDREVAMQLVRDINALQNAGKEVPSVLRRQALDQLPETYNYFAKENSPDMGKRELQDIRRVIDTLQTEEAQDFALEKKKNTVQSAEKRREDQEKIIGIRRDIQGMTEEIDRKEAGIHDFRTMVDNIDAESEDTMEATSNDDWVKDQVKNKKAEEEARARNAQLNEPKKKGFFGRLFS